MANATNIGGVTAANSEIAPASYRVNQKTIRNPIECTGTGLHSGARVSLSLRPASPDTGIIFRRTDVGRNGKGVDIPARWDNVTDTMLCTTLGDGNDAVIGTIEHLMAALAGCGIDNIIIELNGPEVPIMDGSSADFVFLLECAGFAEQSASRRCLQILKRVQVGDADKSATLTPGAGQTFSFEIDFANTVIARQEFYVDVSDENFRSEVSRARTFGFDHEVAKLRAMGLARGGSLDNAVVVSKDGILNEGGLRYDDEFVRHKVLDSIGDLYLAGCPVVGHSHGYKAGHALTNELLHALMTDRSAWRMTTFEDIEFGHSAPAWLADAVAINA